MANPAGEDVYVDPRELGSGPLRVRPLNRRRALGYRLLLEGAAQSVPVRVQTILLDPDTTRRVARLDLQSALLSIVYFQRGGT